MTQSTPPYLLQILPTKDAGTERERLSCSSRTRDSDSSARTDPSSSLSLCFQKMEAAVRIFWIIKKKIKSKNNIRTRCHPKSCSNSNLLVILKSVNNCIKSRTYLFVLHVSSANSLVLNIFSYNQNDPDIHHFPTKLVHHCR